MNLENKIFTNLRDERFSKSVLPFSEHVLSIATSSNYVYVGLAKFGCHIFRILEGKWEKFLILGEQPTNKNSDEENLLLGGSTCTELSIANQVFLYIKDVEESTSICIHNIKDLLERNSNPSKIHTIARRAPMVVVPDMHFIALSNQAWQQSWTTMDKTTMNETANLNNSIRILDISTFATVKDFVACSNSISMMKVRCYKDKTLLGVSDVREGIKVYDLKHETDDGYACIYQVPVDEVRTFQLVDMMVVVFHRFESNITFWNMEEQKTILCIDIQDQMKEIINENCDDDSGDEDGDSGHFDQSFDHVTSVTSLSLNSENIIIYGTHSGCIYGMSVESRSKLFNISLPEIQTKYCSNFRDVTQISYLGNGQIVVIYDGYCLSLFDYGAKAT